MLDARILALLNKLAIDGIAEIQVCRACSALLDALPEHSFDCEYLAVKAELERRIGAGEINGERK